MIESINIDSVSIWDSDSQWLELVILGSCSSIVVTSDSGIVTSPLELLETYIQNIYLVSRNIRDSHFMQCSILMFLPK